MPTFSGRARRKEYWMFTLIYMIFSITLLVIDVATGLGVLSVIFSLVMLVPSLSVLVRRLHDTNRSGWWILISLIPLVGAIILLIFLVQDSDDANTYGFDPKANTVF